MNAPDKCPKCGLPAQINDDGAPSVRYGGQLYQCWTVVDPKSGEADEDFHCLKRQRDALAARVKELEAERNKAVARYEFVRRLTPRQFSELAKDNLSSGIPFDDIVDSRIKWAKP